MGTDVGHTYPLSTQVTSQWVQLMARMDAVYMLTASPHKGWPVFSYLWVPNFSLEATNSEPQGVHHTLTGPVRYLLVDWLHLTPNMSETVINDINWIVLPMPRDSISISMTGCLLCHHGLPSIVNTVTWMCTPQSIYWDLTTNVITLRSGAFKELLNLRLEPTWMGLATLWRSFKKQPDPSISSTLWRHRVHSFCPSTKFVCSKKGPSWKQRPAFTRYFMCLSLGLRPPGL
jgi:hypothetical protein